MANGSDETKAPTWLVGILATLFTMAVGSGLVAWRDVSVLAASVEPFVAAGPRFTAVDGARLERRINECEEGLRQFQIEYKEHVAWGKQWVKGAEFRFDLIDRNSGNGTN